MIGALELHTTLFSVTATTERLEFILKKLQFSLSLFFLFCFVLILMTAGNFFSKQVTPVKEMVVCFHFLLKNLFWGKRYHDIY